MPLVFHVLSAFRVQRVKPELWHLCAGLTCSAHNSHCLAGNFTVAGASDGLDAYSVDFIRQQIAQGDVSVGCGQDGYRGWRRSVVRHVGELVQVKDASCVGPGDPG